MFRYTLGLDIGIASIGWAVLRNDSEDNPMKIEDLGVRAFEIAENPKNGDSPALHCKLGRNIRRLNRRHRHRKARIKLLLEQTGIISRAEMEKLFENSSFEKDVYALRAEGLDRKLDREEWIRVLIHLTQRRGSCFNGVLDSDRNIESPLTAISANMQLMEEKGYRTAGEMYSLDPKFTLINPDGTVWRKVKNHPGRYDFTSSRNMIEQEIHVLFNAQRHYGNPFAGELLETQYASILLSQRSFDEGPGNTSPYKAAGSYGKCLFEPNEPRAFKACYTFEYYRILEYLTRIRISSKDSPTRPLTKEERESIIALALTTENLNYSLLRKTLSLPDNARFSAVHYQEGIEATNETRMKLPGMRAYHAIRKSLDSISQGYISTLSQDQLDQIGTTLSLYKTSERRIPKLKEIGLDDVAIHALMPLSFHDVGNLSLKAIKKVIPYLEDGLEYDRACKAAYGSSASKMFERSLFLSFNNLRAEGALNSIVSPVVLRAISQTCKVVNAIVREYGSPEAVHIVLSREIKRTFAGRINMNKSYQKAVQADDEKKAIIKEIKGEDASDLDVVKYKLFESQNGICLYSGHELDKYRLFEEGYAVVDHIIPYSICFDDSNDNKVLVLGSEKEKKGSRLPAEYIAVDGESLSRFVHLVDDNVSYHNKRQNLLRVYLSEAECEEIKENNLFNSHFIAKTLYQVFDRHLEFAPSNRNQKVLIWKNSFLYFLQNNLRVQDLMSNGDLCYAAKAAVAAATTESLVQRISNHAKREEWGNSVEKHAGSFIDPETGELMSPSAFNRKYPPQFPSPWFCFSEELHARLSVDPYHEIKAMQLASYDAGEKIHPIFISRMTKRKTTGAAHEDTIRSAKKPGYGVIKTPLVNLKLTPNGEIKDYYNPESDRLLYEALKARLKEFKGDAKKAFAEPFYKPKSDGAPGPVVHKVKTVTKTNLNVPVRGGIANNGDMVRIDVFCVEGDGYYFVPIYVSDTVKETLPNLAVVPNVDISRWKAMEEKDFLFSLYPGDLIYVESKKAMSFLKSSKEGRGASELLSNGLPLYFIMANIANGSIAVTTHDRKYGKSSLGIKTLISLRKLEVDVLGRYHEVRLPETRRTFR